MSPLSHHGGFAVCCTQKHPYFIKKSSPSLPLPRSEVIALSLKRSSDKIPVDLLCKQMRFGWGPLLRVRGSVHIPLIKAAAAEAKPLYSDADAIRYLVTGFIFILMWIMYFLYNRCTSWVYEYFPFPFFVSAVHLLVSVACYSHSWSLGFLQIAPIDMDLLKVIAPAAVCHAIGSGAIDYRSRFSACFRPKDPPCTMDVISPRCYWTGLIEIVNWADQCGVSMICLTEFPFNQTVFTSEIIATLCLSVRNTLSKKAMKLLESRNVQVYMSIIALFFCLPAAICIDGPKLMQYGFKDAVAKKGMVRFIYELLISGLLYHLHSKVAITTLERVTPISQSVANILLRVHVIALPFVGKVITTPSKIGAAIAVYGAFVYLWTIG